MFREFNVKFEDVEMIGGADNLLEGTEITKVIVRGDNNKMSSLDSMLKDCNELDTIDGELDLNGVSDIDNLLEGTELVKSIDLKNINNENISANKSFPHIEEINIGGELYNKKAMQNVIASKDWTFDNITYSGTVGDNVVTKEVNIVDDNKVTIQDTLEQKAKGIEIIGQTYENLVDGSGEATLLDELTLESIDGNTKEFNPHIEQPVCIEVIEGNTVQDEGNIYSIGELKEDGTYKIDILSSNKNNRNSNVSILLPQPLNKIGDIKDKFYWDDNKGHYCIEQNIDENLEVLDTPNIIDLPHLNKKYSLDTYMPTTYVECTNNPMQPSRLLLESDTVRYKPSTLEADTDYTIQFECKEKSDKKVKLNLGGTEKEVDVEVGLNHVSITTPSEIDTSLYKDRLFLSGAGNKVADVIVNKGEMNQYPEYFDGVANVGVLQDDKYRIDITSRSICLLFEKGDCIPFVSGTMWYTDFLKNKVDVIPGETYIAIMYNTVSSGFSGLNVRCYSKDGKFIKDIDTNSGLNLKDRGRFTVPQDCYYINFKMYTYEISDDLFSTRKLMLYKGNFSNIETNKDAILNMARPASKLSFTLSQPLMKIGDIADKLYWNKSNKRYEIDRAGSIEVPSVTGDIIDLPRLYQREDTNFIIESGNIKPSKTVINYLDID